MSQTGIALALYLAHVIEERAIDLDAPQQGEDQNHHQHHTEQTGWSPAPAMPTPRRRDAYAAEQNDDEDHGQQSAHGVLLRFGINVR